jgi:TetR/AcrR family transcriptional repressor of nem operon
VNAQRISTAPPAPPHADTRARIVAAAGELIHEQGYAATGVAAIMERAGVGSGSFYHFFASKEALLLAVLDRYFERLEEEIAGPVRAASADPLERVFLLLDFYRRFLVATDFHLGCPIGNLAGELADSHPAVRERLAALFAAWRRLVVESFETIARRTRRKLDVDGLSRLVLAVMEGAVMQARVERSLAPLDAAVAHLRRYLEPMTRTKGSSR